MSLTRAPQSPTLTARRRRPCPSGSALCALRLSAGDIWQSLAELDGEGFGDALFGHGNTVDDVRTSNRVLIVCDD